MSFNRGGWPFPGQFPNMPFRLNRHSPQAEGLVGWWPMREFGTKLIDYSGSGLHADFPGGANNPTLQTEPTLGVVLDFDGSDYIDVGAANVTDITGPITVSAWFLNNQALNYHAIVAKDDGTNRNYQLYIDNSDYLAFAVFQSGSFYEGNGGDNSVSTGVLYHGVGTYDGAEAAAYLDGIKQINTDALTGPIDNDPVNLHIGQRGDSALRFNGYISDVRIYNRALSAGEAWQLYDPQTRWQLYEPIPRLFPVGAPPAGVATLSINVSESVGVTELVGSPATSLAGISKSEAVNVAESITALLTSYIDVSDSVSVAESVTTILKALISVSDSVSVSEAIQASISNLEIGISESISISETIAVILKLLPNVSESIAVAEAIKALLISLVNVSDSVGIAESTETRLKSFVNVSDSIAVGESVIVVVQAEGIIAVTVSDAVAVAESVNAIISNPQASTSDLISLTESVSASMGNEELSVSDSVSVAELVNMLALFDVPVSDTVSIAESVGIDPLLISALVSDTISVAESVSMFLPGYQVIGDPDNVAYVLFRDRRAYVVFRDRRAYVIYKDKRSIS